MLLGMDLLLISTFNYGRNHFKPFFGVKRMFSMGGNNYTHSQIESIGLVINNNFSSTINNLDIIIKRRCFLC